MYREAWGFGFCFGEGEGEEAVAACEEGTEEGVEVEAEEAVTRGQVGTLMYMKVTECVDTYLDNNVAAVLVYTPSYNVAIPRLRTKRRRTRNAREIAVVWSGDCSWRRVVMRSRGYVRTLVDALLMEPQMAWMRGGRLLDMVAGL